jgi:hypothetical protein
MNLEGTSISRLILDNMSMDKTASPKTEKVSDIEEARKVSSGLAKVASYPYKEESFHAIQEIMKIASAEMKDLIGSLEAAQSRNSELEKVSEVRVLIEDMAKIGYVEEHNVEEKIAELLTKDKNQLSVVKEAVKMASGGKQGNVFFELEKDAETGPREKLGMFDGVIE